MPAFDSGKPQALVRLSVHVAAGHEVITDTVVSLLRNISSA